MNFKVKNDTFLRALLRQPTEYTPMWMMRQAGRFLPEYRETRKRAGSFLGLCKSPDFATEVTMQPLDRFPLDAAILFAPVGALIPEALRHTAKGGTVVCAGIHMSDIPSFPYFILWGERKICSIANLTRRDGEEFMKIAPQAKVKTEIETFKLEQANDALTRLRIGRIRGAAVLVMD